MKKETFSVVGAGNSRWGQAYADENLFLVVEIEAAADGFKIGHDFVEEIKTKFESLAEPDLESLKKLRQSLEMPYQYHLIIAAFKEQTLFLVSSGAVQALVKRDGRLVTILQGEDAVSGPVRENDRLLLATPSFLQAAGTTDLEKTFNNPWTELEDAFATLINGQEKSDGAAGLFIHLGEKEASSQTNPRRSLPRLSVNLWTLFDRLRPRQNREEEIADTKTLHSKKITASIAFILIFLLIASLFFGSSKRAENQRQEILKSVKEAVLPQIEDGKALIGLNVLEARQLLGDARKTLEQATAQLKAGTKEAKEAAALLEDVKKSLTESEREFQVGEEALFYDLTWVKEGAVGTAMAIYENQLVVLDKEQSSIYSLDLESKKAQIAGGGAGFDKGQQIALHGNRVFVLKDDDKTTIVDKDGKTIIENDPEWVEIIDITAYAGNLYLLDRRGFIWKYQPNEAGVFGVKQNYLAKDVVPDFSGATNISINGNVWVLNRGKITKFFRGAPESFILQGLNEDLKEPTVIYASEDNNYIFLLDKGLGKIFVFGKDGRFEAQFVWEGFKNAIDMVVADSLKKILVLTPGKIYGLDINF